MKEGEEQSERERNRTYLKNKKKRKKERRGRREGTEKKTPWIEIRVYRFRWVFEVHKKCHVRRSMWDKSNIIMKSLNKQARKVKKKRRKKEKKGVFGIQIEKRKLDGRCLTYLQQHLKKGNPPSCLADTSRDNQHSFFHSPLRGESNTARTTISKQTSPAVLTRRSTRCIIGLLVTVKVICGNVSFSSCILQQVSVWCVVREVIISLPANNSRKAQFAPLTRKLAEHQSHLFSVGSIRWLGWRKREGEGEKRTEAIFKIRNSNIKAWLQHSSVSFN